MLSLPCSAIQCPISVISTPVPLANTHFFIDTTTSFRSFASVNLAKDWQKITASGSFFLQKNYLAALEHCPPEGMDFRYLVFYKEGQPVGVAYLQILHFNAFEALKHQPLFQRNESIKEKITQTFAQKIDFDVLVCGNSLMTGEYGYLFDNQAVTKEAGKEILIKGLHHFGKILRQKGRKVSVTLIKELFEENRLSIGKSGYHEFCIQPNMILDLPAAWQNFEDYLQAMSSKYRVRAKRAAKKGVKLKKKELNIEELEEKKEKMYDLYRQVVDGAEFNGNSIQKDYFLNFKQQLGEQFRVIGYFLEEELVGFYTVFLHGEQMEAHYLGMETALNHDLQLYLNMLYDMVKMGITHRVQRIVFARTALEIKSSIGAVPYSMQGYVKHCQPVVNALFQPVFNLLNPKTVWVQRHPFKEE